MKKENVYLAVETRKRAYDKTRQRLESAEFVMAKAATDLEAARAEFWEMVGPPPALSKSIKSKLQRLIDDKQRQLNFTDMIGAGFWTFIMGGLVGLVMGSTVLTAFAFFVLALGIFLFYTSRHRPPRLVKVHE